jgi:hypothetical protein
MHPELLKEYPFAQVIDLQEIPEHELRDDVREKSIIMQLSQTE